MLQPTTNNTYTLETCQANLPYGFDNLVTIFNQATIAELESGLGWYKTAYNAAQDLSKVYGLPLDRVCKVIACLSPQLRWSDNLRAAEIVIRYYLGSGSVPSYSYYLDKKFTLNQLAKECLTLPDCKANVTGANKIKALWILQGFDALSGAKVISFAENILRFADSAKVTVDSHAINAWFGVTKRQSVALAAPSFYQIISADYTRVAQLKGISPLECQAIIWVVLRRLSGSDQGDK